ncbi:FMN adenylyltransferase,Riboflavin kinase [Candidatus Hydrogenisulfobacillus filiaventi]|uniref:Riboflavin biosynthesis protein n=1 Tax=Candidatus Hydrogenisulfobacillus filiaventi TaxID=2707344 RepID=A0A6F8ZH46_9FIRM|nr:riboflavin biosynthesis protein RibF [Bacillota bacterium]CAB1128775.1 FMN adenylyltransferase,Riboflavin kinase [Candidatus Hydrogenisulfobacillus filiaventi]
MRRILAEEMLDEPTVVTVGSFDGVHRGHQALLAAAREVAAREGLPMVVLTFDPHPRAVLKGPLTRYLLTPTPVKLAVLEELGVPAVKVMPFTPAVAAQPAEEFLEQELAGRLRARVVVVGYSFTFGARAQGTPELLQHWMAARGGEAVVVPPVRLADGTPVSSSYIRERILDGDLEAAEAALGHPFRVEGPVRPGLAQGRQLGFPTANVEVPPEQIMGPYGVYAGFARLAGEAEPRPAVANWGVRPTVVTGHGHPWLEVYLLDADRRPVGDLRGQVLRFDCRSRIRAERRFHSLEALKAQIARDVEEARRRLVELG